MKSNNRKTVKGLNKSGSTRRQFRHWDAKFWYAVATLVGSTVGIGFYGIPFTFQKAGLAVGLLFWVAIVGLVLLTNLLYGEVVLRTHFRHQFVGYVNKYLGRWAKRVNLFIFWVSVYGALVGIIIISGDFLSNVLSFYFNFSPVVFSTIFIAVAVLLVAAGLKTVSRFDYFMMILFVLIVALIGIVGARQIGLGNYTFDLTVFWFLPFGVIMFAMNSMPGIPLMREVLSDRERDLKRAITYGTFIPALLYLVFSLLVVGVSGEITSPDAISGLQGFLGTKIVVIGSAFGFLTSTTIFLNLAFALRESLREDFRVRRRWVWVLAMIPPYLLFLSGVRNFIDIIGLVGGVAVSLQVVLLIFLYAKAKRMGERVPEYSIRLPVWSLYLMMLVFALGAVYTVLVR